MSAASWNNKKFDVMLTRRARKTIAVPVRKLSVYLQPFRRSSFLECALETKIAKINKNPYFESLGSFIVIAVNTTEKLVTMLVVIGSMPKPICNRFDERLANNGKRRDPLRSNLWESLTVPEPKVFQTADGKDLVILACTVFDWSTRVTDRRTELRWLRPAESSTCFRA